MLYVLRRQGFTPTLKYLARGFTLFVWICYNYRRKITFILTCMTQEKWTELLDKIKSGFTIEEEGKEDLEVGHKEFVIFNGSIGRVKLERIVRPKLLDTKTLYSNRPGGKVAVDYVYSDTEEVASLKAYRWSDIEARWSEIKADNFIT